DLSAIADDVIAAAVSSHREALGDCVALADEIDHRLGALALCQRENRVDFAAVGLHHVVRAALLGEREGLFSAVDDDNFGGAKRAQHLDADMAKTAGANDDGVFAWQEMSRRFFGRS